MRAKPVVTNAHTFDFDDTLIKSDVKTLLYRDGKLIKSLTPAEYNVYKKQPNDTFDMSDFDDPTLIEQAKKYIMWPLLEKYDKENNSMIYILTARHNEAKIPIFEFITKNGIKNVPIENIFTIGDNKGLINIPVEKRKVMEIIAKQHLITYFYDDNIETIEFIKNIPGLKAYLVE